MKITATLYAATRKEWREWLEANHGREREIWLVSYRKATGRPSVPYDDAVEEALCFGWIDSTRKRVDEDCFAQRYTPRRETSPYSQLNKERLAHLIRDGPRAFVGRLRLGHVECDSPSLASEAGPPAFSYSRLRASGYRTSAPTRAR